MATIVIDRLEARNAVDARAIDELYDAFTDLAADADVWALVLRGAGGTFCSGQDLRNFQGFGKARFDELFLAIRSAPQPVIAVVEGAALGAGAAMCLAADLRLLTTTAELGWPEVRRGFAPALNGLYLIQSVPRNVAAELLFLGRPIGADRARELGLANWVVPPDEIDSALASVLDQLAQSSPLGVRGAKEAIGLADAGAGADALTAARRIVDRVALSADAREGVRAFLEKRRPEWSGR